MNEGSIYWTQHTHEDSQPQFKNDHRQSSSAVTENKSHKREESLHPKSMSPPTSSSIYRTDDQHDRHRGEDDDERFVSTRRKDMTTTTVPVGSVTAVDLDHDDRTNNDDDNVDIRHQREQLDMAIEETTTINYDNYEDDEDDDDENDGGSYWEAKQRRWTEENQRDVDDNDGGYQILTCRAINSLYIPFRW